MNSISRVNVGLATSFTIGFWLAFDSIAIGIVLGITMGIILTGLSSFKNKGHDSAE